MHRLRLPLLCLTAIMALAAPSLAGLPLTGPVPQFTVPVATSAPVLDGTLDDSCWRQALVSRAFYPQEANAVQDVPSESTTLYLTRHQHTLLVGLDCRPVPGKSGLESVQVMLDTMHVHELSHTVLVRSDGTSQPSAWWDPVWATRPGHYQAAVAQHDGGWSAEIAIDLTHYPYARSHTEDVGCYIGRQFADDTRLAWALPNRRTCILSEAWEPYLARHIAGLDLPAMFPGMEAENDVTFAPLVPRAEAVRRQVGVLLSSTRRAPEVRLRAASLDAAAEEATPRRRECVERIAVRGLPEREAYLRDAEALAAALGGKPAAGSASAMLALAVDPEGPGYWEMDGTHSLGRSRGRSYNLGLMRYGIPLGSVEEREVLPPLDIEKRCSGTEDYLRKQGFTLSHETRGPFDVCFAESSTTSRFIAYLRRGTFFYSAGSAVPGGGEALLTALAAQQPFDEQLADRLWSQFPVPVRVGEVEGLLAFPMPEAAVVVPAALAREAPGMVEALPLALGGAKAAAPAVPAAGPVVVVATAPHEEALRAVGFTPDGWRSDGAEGHVALRQEDGRVIIGVWGRDRAGLEHAVRVLADLRRTLTGRELLIGDLHLHTMLSDGSGGPRQVLLATIAAGMDFAAITDHYRGGASYEAKAWADRWVPSFTMIRGHEAMGADFEMLALGISHDIDTQPDPKQIAAQIHAQGGTALLCHPYGPPYQPILDHLEALGLDGVDRFTPQVAGFLAAREVVGRQPIVTAVTDSHSMSFVQPYRTLVFTSDRSEQGILSALRDGWYLTLDDRGFSGAPHLVEVMLALIGEKQFLESRYRVKAQARADDLLRAWRAGEL